MNKKHKDNGSLIKEDEIEPAPFDKIAKRLLETPPKPRKKKKKKKKEPRQK
ncbi:hypothetical protein MYX64_03915 [Nitrospinae bacterium AH_259_B05_G02_I21]|nr:hypothetical protein [Nitrospinae bacterium AH_259_B05_G02_I21]